MNRLIRKLTLVWLISCVCASAAARQATQSENPAERRAKEFARLIDSGTRAELKNYAKENFAPNFLNVPMDQHLGFFSSVQDSTRGVEFHSIQEAKPNEATVLLKAKLTGQWLALFVRVEPEAPHRIAGLGLRPPKPPASPEGAQLNSPAHRAGERDHRASKP